MLYKQIGKIEMEDKNMVKVIRVYGECLGALRRRRSWKEETPVIIPNTEVKLLFADGTASSRESKLLPGFLFYTLNIDFIFYVFRCLCF